MISSSWAITRTFNKTNLIGLMKLDSKTSRWNGSEGADPCRMFAAINSVCSGDAYFGNGITSPGTIFGGALPRETGRFKPQGKLPFALPKTLKTVQDQKFDLG